MNALVEEYREEIQRFADTARDYCDLLDSWRADASQWASVHDFLTEVEPLLPALYLGAIAFPGPDEWYDPDAEVEPADPSLDPSMAASRAPAEDDGTLDDLEDLDPAEVDGVYEEQRVRQFPGLEGYEFGQESLRAALATYLEEYDAYEQIADPYERLFGSDTPVDDDLEEEAAPRGSLALDLASIYDWLKEQLIVLDHGSSEATLEALWGWSSGFDLAGANLTDALRAVHSLLWQHAPELEPAVLEDAEDAGDRERRAGD